MYPDILFFIPNRPSDAALQNHQKPVKVWSPKLHLELIAIVTLRDRVVGRRD